jgi:hypothetical protein
LAFLGPEGDDMSVFMLIGMVTGRSAAAARADRLAIDYVEIQERGGGSTRLSNVCAAPELASILKVGASGKFFFRDVGSTHRLLGIERTDGLQAFDLRDATVHALHAYVERASGGGPSGRA